MKVADFEYAIKKDVKNNPIVREIDRRRQQELISSLALVFGLLVFGLLLAWQQFWLGNYRAEIAQMKVDIEREQELNRRLTLERAALENPAVVAREAAGRLEMIVPRPEDVLVLERATGAPPPRAVVASRRP